MDFWKRDASSVLVNRKRKKTDPFFSPFAFFGNPSGLREIGVSESPVSKPRPNSDSEEEEVDFIEEIFTAPVSRGKKRAVFSV